MITVEFYHDQDQVGSKHLSPVLDDALKKLIEEWVTSGKLKPDGDVAFNRFEIVEM